MLCVLRWASIAAVAVIGSSACSYQVGFEPEYVPPERPAFIAQGSVLIVMPPEQNEFTYEGPPDSRIGDFTTMTIPLGRIVREVSEEVFASCFADGVLFGADRTERGDYVVALEGNLESFVYRYAEIVDAGFSDEDPESWIVPEVEIALAVRAYDSRGQRVLDETYESGVVAGEGYLTTRRPAERINETLHATLHQLMLQIAADVRPLLIGECEIEDLNNV